MITAYHRPQTLDEALTLLTQPNILPLGGGTLLSKAKTDPIELADLQLLGLDTVKKNGNNLEFGATLTLQSLLESEYCPEPLKTALKLEAPLNIRNSATVAGTLVACDGRSTFATLLLALDAKLTIQTADRRPPSVVNIGDFLPLRNQPLTCRRERSEAMSPRAQRGHVAASAAWRSPQARRLPRWRGHLHPPLAVRWIWRSGVPKVEHMTCHPERSEGSRGARPPLFTGDFSPLRGSE